MAVRGIRGATTCINDAERIMTAARELLLAVLDANPTLKPEDIASVLFTATADLQAAFPARAIRELGWTDVPLIDALEMDVPGSLPRCMRLLIHWNTDLPQSAVKHVYLHDAVILRPDLAK